MIDKTYSPKRLEEKYSELWEKSLAFAADPNSPHTPYTIMMPPANVTGTLHVGHALTYTLQDILIRYHRMLGQDVLWQPGTDHAGIATQMVVEKKIDAEGLDRRQMGREKFLERIWEWKEESGGTISRQLRLLGASADWDRERFTLDEGLSEAVRVVFVRLYKEGLIYKDKRLVNWDPKFLTAVSDLEVEQREVKGHLWYIKYPLADDPSLFITVATTRPETLFGDMGIAVHPEDIRFQKFIGKNVRHPFDGRLLPIVADLHSDPKKGSGAVKITPAHDFNDFNVGKRHGLEFLNILTPDAHLNENVPMSYRGLERFIARKKIVEELDSMGLLERIEPIQHTEPHGERSGVVIEPMLMDQWYVDAKKLAIPALKAVEDGRTIFVPSQWAHTYFEWLRNIQPWCISRQIWWGHRIPAWYGPDGHVFVELDETAAISAAQVHYGKAVPLTQENDVLDTWFSSALWPFSTLGWPHETQELKRYYPTDVLVTGLDIIFFWVARMMMMGIHFMGEVPFRTVYLHAMVRDDKGQKMSKTKGNVLDPVTLIDKFGTDALRFTLCALSAQGRDIKLSENRVEGYRNFTTKIWNVARFLEMNDCRFDPSFNPEKTQESLSRWIIHEIKILSDSVRDAFNTYKFNEAAHLLYHGIWHTFCDWAVEFSKCIFNGEDLKSQEKSLELKNTLAWAFVQILHVMHPITPFITEGLWEFFKSPQDQGNKSLLIKAPWPNFPETLKNPTLKTEMDWVIGLISAVRSLRALMNIPPKEHLSIFVQGANTESLKLLDHYKQFVCPLARIKDISFDSLAHNVPSLNIIYKDMTLCIPALGVLDVNAEITRLSKEILKLDRDMEDLKKRLDNSEFISKAPLDIVEELQTRAKFFKSQKELFSQILDGLNHS